MPRSFAPIEKWTKLKGRYRVHVTFMVTVFSLRIGEGRMDPLSVGDSWDRFSPVQTGDWIALG